MYMCSCRSKCCLPAYYLLHTINDLISWSSVISSLLNQCFYLVVKSYQNSFKYPDLKQRALAIQWTFCLPSSVSGCANVPKHQLTCLLCFSVVGFTHSHSLLNSVKTSSIKYRWHCQQKRVTWGWGVFLLRPGTCASTLLRVIGANMAMVCTF